MVHVPQRFSRKLTERILRWIAPPREHFDELPPELEAIAERAEAYFKREAWVGLVWMLGIAVFAVLVLSMLDRVMLPQIIEPVWHTRTWIRWSVIGIAAGFLLGLVVARKIRRAAWGEELENLRRYFEHKRGYDPVPAERWSILFWAAMGLFGATAWNYGEIIDRNGIRFAGGWLVDVSQSYADVRSVELYDALLAPIGRVDRVNLVLTFAEGPPLELQASKGDGPKGARALMRAAEYVSEQSRVPLTRGDVRPERR